MSLDEQLARQQRVPAGKMGALYQRRTHLSIVIRKVETRIAELRRDGTLATGEAEDPDLDPEIISGKAMGQRDRGRRAHDHGKDRPLFRPASGREDPRT